MYIFTVRWPNPISVTSNASGAMSWRFANQLVAYRHLLHWSAFFRKCARAQNDVINVTGRWEEEAVVVSYGTKQFCLMLKTLMSSQACTERLGCRYFKPEGLSQK